MVTQHYNINNGIIVVPPIPCSLYTSVIVVAVFFYFTMKPVLKSTWMNPFAVLNDLYCI